MSLATRPSNKLLSFEGLRGIASLIVVIWHLQLTFWITFTKDMEKDLACIPTPIASMLCGFLDGLQSGRFAVWVFWVMSAFVLSVRFFEKNRDGLHAGAFSYLEDAALRRYPRLLFPILASVIVAYFLHSLGCMRNREVAIRLGPAYDEWLGRWYGFQPRLPGALKSACWDSFFDYSVKTTYNNVLWTMEKEFYGSVFLFSFLGLFGHRSSRILLYPVLGLVIFQLEIGWMSAFVAGILLCDFYVNGTSFHRRLAPINRPLVTCIIWVAVITFAGLGYFGSISYLILAFVAVTLAAFSVPSQNMLSNRVLVFLGKISFSMYLIHIPIICSFSCWMYLSLVATCGHAQSALLSSLATVLLSIVGGYLLYVAVDQWSIGISKCCSTRIIQFSQACLQYRRSPASGL